MADLLKARWFWPLLLLILANETIFLTGRVELRYGATLLLLAFLPGWVWIRALFSQETDLAEQFTLAAGLSLAFTVITAMLAVYLPGPISLPKLLIIINFVTVLGLIVNRLTSPGQVAGPGRSPANQPRLGTILSNQGLLVLIILLLLTAALRLPRLGYAEFHEDEAEALMLGVRLLNGEDYALFLHRKGPAQMLLPVAFWLLTDRITEALARFPFALSSILSAATIFFIGRRWFGWVAGGLAAWFWAVNGYATGFGRMVQYQALIFFLGPLALYCLYLAWIYSRPRWQLLGAVLLATCLLAHFDALLWLPAAAYLSWLLVRQGREEALRSRGASLLPLIVFVMLLAAFYVPYMRDPEFTHTAAYLTESRVKPGLLYNNLELLGRLDRAYSSRFYLPLLALGIGCFIIEQIAPLSIRRQRGLIAGGLILATTIWLPDLWRMGPVNLALLPWLLLIGWGWWQLATVEARTAWVMAAAPFVGYIFLVDDPRTHVYILYPGAALLAGLGAAFLIDRWKHWLARQPRDPAAPLDPYSPADNSGLANYIVLTLTVFLTSMIVSYQLIIFLSPEARLTKTRQVGAETLPGLVYGDFPPAREYFGYPKQEGWKAIGALRARGQFPGDFRSVNEDFIIPIWYNYGQPRSCYDTPAYFFVRIAELEKPVTNNAYHEVGQVWREYELRLRILSDRGRPPAVPTPYRLEDWAAEFDRLATPRQFLRQAEPAQPLGAQFGPAIEFLGYELATPVVAPGDTLYLTLYWQALATPGQDYRVFVHLTDGSTLWSQQDDNPACRLPTSVWRPDQMGVGQFRLSIPPEMPPGRYPLIIGLYQAGTLERLKITGGAGQVGDDFLYLRDIEVIEPTSGQSRLGN